MGVLFNKRVEDIQAQPTDTHKAFVIVLEKYKMPVIVTSIGIDEGDDGLLTIDFDHEIEAPENEVADELGRVIMERIELGLKLDPNTMSAETETEKE